MRGSLILPGEGIVRASEKPSDCYVEVVLMQPIQFRPDEPVRPVGDVVVCNLQLAEHLASSGKAAIVYERLNPKLPLFVGADIRA